MKKIKMIATGLALSLALISCSSSQTQKGVRDSKSKFMTINGKEISNKEFFKQYDLFKGVLADPKIISDVQNAFIIKSFVSEKIKEFKIEIKQEEYDNGIKNATARFGGDDKYADYLDFLGVSKEQYEQNIKDGIDVEKYREWYVKNINFEPEEIKKHYEENIAEYETREVKHILVDSEEKAYEVRQKLLDGQDFKGLSDEYSIDKEAKKNGGSFGQIKRNSPYLKEFLDAAFELEEGGISKPVNTKYGYHIIVASNIKAGMDKFMNEIKENLGQIKFSEHFKEEIGKIEVKLFDKNGNELKPEENQKQKNTNN